MPAFHACGTHPLANVVRISCTRACSKGPPAPRSRAIGMPSGPTALFVLTHFTAFTTSSSIRDVASNALSSYESGKAVGGCRAVDPPSRSARCSAHAAARSDGSESNSPDLFRTLGRHFGLACGTARAALASRLFISRARMRKSPFCLIFTDLAKAFDRLVRELVFGFRGDEPWARRVETLRNGGVPLDLHITLSSALNDSVPCMSSVRSVQPYVMSLATSMSGRGLRSVIIPMLSAVLVARDSAVNLELSFSIWVTLL